MEIEDEYTAFCFDEACDYILTQLEDEKKILFEADKKVVRNKNLELAKSLRKGGEGK